MASVVVVGAGLAGSSAAWRLAQRGHEVTVVERATPAHRFGSSHGSARIFRYAYAQQHYVEMVVEAERGWLELEAAQGTALLSRTGSLDHGVRSDPAAMAAMLERAGVEHELLSPEETTARWGIPASTPALWQPTSGVIDAERAVQAMVHQAAAHGARVELSWELSRLERRGTGYRVHATDGRSIDAEQVVVATGGWLPDLLPELNLPAAFLQTFPALEVRQEQAYHFPYREVDAVWPALIHRLAEMDVYGLPGGRDAGWTGLKVAEYNGGKRIRSAAMHDGVLDDANRRRVVAYVAQHLPGLVPEPYAETTCLFTNTPTEDFVIDRVEGVTVMSPCSGHGAKFAPLLGELAMNLVEGRGDVPKLFRPSLAAGP
jgi:sarcosine oxidase